MSASRKCRAVLWAWRNSYRDFGISHDKNYQTINRKLRSRFGQFDSLADLRHAIGIPLETEAGVVGDFEHAVLVHLGRFEEDDLDVLAGRDVLDPTRVTDRGSDLQVGGEADRGVPTVRHHQDRMIVGVLGDAELLGKAADLRDVGLNVIDCSALDPRDEPLSSRRSAALPSNSA